MRVVLDTNVLLAAFATRGLCEALYQACLAAHEPMISQLILEELAKHLAGKLKLPRARVDEILGTISAEFTLVRPAAVPADAYRDADDLMVLGTAVAGGARCIVTGDRDLLAIARYRDIAILSPREFYDQLR